MGFLAKAHRNKLLADPFLAARKSARSVLLRRRMWPLRAHSEGFCPHFWPSVLQAVLMPAGANLSGDHGGSRGRGRVGEDTGQAPRQQRPALSRAGPGFAPRPPSGVPQMLRVFEYPPPPPPFPSGGTVRHTAVSLSPTERYLMLFLAVCRQVCPRIGQSDLTHSRTDERVMDSSGDTNSIGKFFQSDT